MARYSEQIITGAVETLKNGGVVVYPTETVYGIGCDPFNMEACERVQQMKKREDAKPLLLLASSLAQVEECAGELPEIPLRLAQIFWPGPLTMVIWPKNNFPGYLYGRTGGVAFRVTSHPVAEALARKFGFPVTSTSANVTGRTPIVTYENAQELFGKSADIVLETAEPLHGRPSTVIDLTSGHIAVIREGSISLERIQEVL